MRPTCAAVAASLMLAACAGTDAGTGGGGFCFPARQQDIFPAPEDRYQGTQLVCSLNRINPGARDEYIERYPELQLQAGDQGGVY